MRLPNCALSSVFVFSISESKYDSNFSLSTAIKDIPKEGMEVILNGGKERFSVASKSLGITRDYSIDYDGVIPFLEHQYKEAHTAALKRWAKGFMDEIKCPSCAGSRLRKEACFFKVGDKGIADLAETLWSSAYADGTRERPSSTAHT